MIMVGDKVIFSWNNTNDKLNEYDLLTHRGMVVSKNKDNTYSVLYFDDFYTKIAYNIPSFCIGSISILDEEIEKINERYKYLIDEEKKKLKTVSQVEKDEQRKLVFNNTKQRIIRNCEWLTTKDIDEEDFINRVKEIANLKKQLFSPNKLPCMDEIHKYNGTIKYNIRQLENERNKIIDRLTGEKELEKWNKL